MLRKKQFEEKAADSVIYLDKVSQQETFSGGGKGLWARELWDGTEGRV